MGAAIAWTEAGWADEALNTAFCALTYLCLPPPPPRSWQCRMRRLNEPETRRTLSPVRQPLPGAPSRQGRGYKVEDLTSVYCDPGRVGSRAALQGSRAETRMSVLRTFRHSHTVSSRQPYSFVIAIQFQFRHSHTVSSQPYRFVTSIQFRHSHTVSSQPAQPSVQPQHTAEHREEH